MNVLVLNAGSSSLKFQVIATDLEQIKEYKDDRILRGEVDGIGGEAIVKVQYRKNQARTLTAPLRDMGAALDYVLRYIASDQSGVSEIKNAGDVNAVGHRVVHGGELFKESTLIDDRVLKGIEDCIDLAPLHNPNNVKGIVAARELFGSSVPQVAVFDTSFHHSIPEQAYSVCDSVSPLSQASHSPLRISRNIAPLCRLPLSCAAQPDPRADKHHHLSSGKWLFGRGHQSRSLHRHLDGNDAARRTCHGNAIGRS